MSATPVLVLLTLAALTHWSGAITCYVCRSKSEPGCDDPFNRNGTGVHTLTCPSNACLKAKGRAKDDSVWFTGVVRGCGTAAMIGCSAVTSQPVPELHLTDLTGELCYCSGNLCNSAPQTSVWYGGMMVVTMVVSFTVASFLALTTDRFLSQ